MAESKRSKQEHAWEINTVVDGAYYVGFDQHRRYYVVTGHTKSGAPKVQNLQEQEVSCVSTPSESHTVISLKLPLEPTGEVITSRWYSSYEKYGFKDGNYKVKLDRVHEPVLQAFCYV